MRSRGHTNQVDLQAVKAIKAEFSSHVKAEDWNCISKPPSAVFHNYSHVLRDDKQYSQQMQFNQPILHHTSPTGCQYGLIGNNSYYLYGMHNVPNVALCRNMEI